MIIRVRISAEDKKTIFHELNERGVNNERLILNDNKESLKFIASINEDMKKL